MPSKMVTHRQKSSESVQAACTTHRQAMADGIAETLNDAALGNHVATIVDKAISRLQAHTAALVTADGENLRERGEDAVARDEHASAVALLREDLVVLRSGVGPVCGDAAVRSLGFDGDTPTDPVAVERVATTVLASLGKLATVESRVDGFSFDPKPWNKRIKAHLSAATSARARLMGELRETEATQRAKDKQMAEYDTTFKRVATLASALLEIAGESDLARRVRPSARRPGQTAENAEEPTTPEEPQVL
jgi:hypothetical protein